MIEHIMVLKRSLAEREIYLWDVGKLALQTFFRASLRGIDVRGFVTNFQEYHGETIMNRPILSPEALRGKENIFVLAADVVTDGVLHLISEFAPCCRWSDALEPNPRLRGVSVLLWGTGEGIWDFIRSTPENGAAVCGFLAADKKVSTQLLGMPVSDPEEYAWNGDENVVIMESYTPHEANILDRLEKTGFTGTVFIREITPPERLWAVDAYCMLDRAMKEGKRILFCCEDAMGRALLHRVFSLYDVPIAREVSYEGTAEDGSDDIWSLADEDPSKSVLLIHSFSEKRRYAAADAANDLGFSLADHNYAATDAVCYNRLRYNNIVVYKADDPLPVSIDYSRAGGLPGWARLGDENADGTRIMVLGGSTSSEIYYPESWVSMLYRKIRASGKQAVIYNGAHESNKAIHELIRMIRDIRTLKPDVVISLSGYNDQSVQPGVFNTVHSDTPFEYWRRMESYMKLIAESEGAAFYSILQPITRIPEKENLYETMLYLDQVHHRAKKFYESRRDDDFYYDLFSLFFHQNDKLIDLCHYSDGGNEILADKIFHMIEDKLL